MLIKSFGLFWQADEVDWTPGKGNREAFRLLGRHGKNRPGLRLADFRHQQGIYVLYGNHGPHYVGLTRAQGNGKRLKDHLTDEHADRWDRFSWFGFRQVNYGCDRSGLCIPRKLAKVTFGNPSTMVADTEALLIKAMGLHNKAEMSFANADEWHQVKLHEYEHYFAKF